MCRSQSNTHANHHQEKTLFQCNEDISHHAHNGSNTDALILFTQLREFGFKPNASTFSSVLKSCAKLGFLQMGKQIHSEVIKLGFESDIYCGSSLVDMYCKCREFHDATHLFDKIPYRNTVTWNALIVGFSQAELYDQALDIYIKMREMGICPSAITLSSVLASCSRLDVEEDLKKIHALSFKLGLQSHVVVGTALIDSYMKSLKFTDANKVFNSMPEKNVFTWTSMVTGYSQKKQPMEVLKLIQEMRRANIKLNQVTYNGLLSSFVSPEDLDHGKQVHCQVIKEGFELEPHVSVALITMYSKCTSASDFCKLCSVTPLYDQVSYNSVIAGFAHLGYGEEVLETFARMNQSLIKPDFYTFGSLLQAIGTLSTLEHGKQTHALVLKTGHFSNPYVQNGLISMYSKCGLLDEAKLVFSLARELDIVSWNSLLAGLSQHGKGLEAVEWFEEMWRVGVKPDHTSFLCVLSSCSHTGLVEKGLEYFDLMKSDRVALAPRVEHYSCIVDLLGRAGYLNEAEELINKMPIKPEASIYRALLSACRVHGNMGMAVRAAGCLLELCPSDASAYVLLSNVFGEKGYWADKEHVRMLMGSNGVTKEPGYSWVGICNEAQTTLGKDLDDPLSLDAQETLV
ncbi:hypothetical protein AMTR_s00012p00252800 [Amborella trichopoda]|uniref:Pentacotripeptide-repeat region of PRORP domain-containing protein n=2 Tax=Amborella trichopoda TaxID=13333 RepID=W1PJQ9_AMBTC|nr:hypothetical protein AMTR_s00012p00252800 [Amborella trichopoda]